MACAVDTVAPSWDTFLGLSVVYEGRPESLQPWSMKNRGTDGWIFSGQPAYGRRT